VCRASLLGFQASSTAANFANRGIDVNQTYEDGLDELLDDFADALTGRKKEPARIVPEPELKLVHSSELTNLAPSKKSRRRKRALRVIDGGRK
jgi:hypothetical protein